MAYTTINKSTDYFNTKLYTGNSATLNVTGVGFQPDFTWLKSRTSSSYGHDLYDAVRGATKTLNSNSNNAEYTEADRLQSFDSDGFTLGSAGATNSSTNYVSWNWKAGTTGSGNTGGSGTYKAYSYSVSTVSGLSIIKYVGNGTGGHTIPHHLGVAPSNVIIKAMTSNSWISKMKGADGYLYLDNDSAYTSNSTWLPTDANNLTLANTWGAYNTNDVTYVAYCFAEKTGYSKFGSYLGNNQTGNNAPFIYTGFKPSWLMVKKYSNTNHWIIWDNKRSTKNGANIIDKKLYANLSNAENGADDVSFLSNGFKFNTNTGDWNEIENYIYMCFGQSLVGSNNVPCTAR